MKITKRSRKLASPIVIKVAGKTVAVVTKHSDVFESGIVTSPQIR